MSIQIITEDCTCAMNEGVDTSILVVQQLGPRIFRNP